MNVGVAASLTDTSRRFGLVALLVIVLAAAQLLFAAHAGAASDDISDHAKLTCEVCLSAAVSDDPQDLGVALAAPILSKWDASSPVAADIVVALALIAAHPRGPPVS